MTAHRLNRERALNQLDHDAGESPGRVTVSMVEVERCRCSLVAVLQLDNGQTAPITLGPPRPGADENQGPNLKDLAESAHAHYQASVKPKPEHTGVAAAVKRRFHERMLERLLAPISYPQREAPPMSEAPATDLPTQELTVVAPDPVDIATHPRLGQRVSALTHARNALATSGSGFLSSRTTMTNPPKHLLKVGDWLLDDTHPETDDDDDAPDPSPYLTVRRPRIGMDYITREQFSAAFNHALANPAISPEHRSAITQVLHEFEYALVDEAHYAPKTPEAD